MSVIENIRSPTKQRKTHKRKYDNPFRPRPADDKKTVMLRLDDEQKTRLKRLVEIQNRLRQRLVEYRNETRANTGRYPSLGALMTVTQECRKNSSEQRELPSGAVEATTSLVHSRSAQALSAGEIADWDLENLGAIYFAGGGKHQYVKLKDGKIWLPKFGWIEYGSGKTGSKGLHLRAVLETPGTYVKGATARMNREGEWRAVISFQRGKLKDVNAAIKEVRDHGLFLYEAQKNGISATKAERIYQAERSEYKRMMEEDAKVYNEDGTFEYKVSREPTTIDGFEYEYETNELLRVMLGLFLHSADVFQRFIPVKDIKAALARDAEFSDYLEQRRRLRKVGVRPRKQWYKGSHSYVFRCDEIVEAIDRWDRWEKRMVMQ